MDIGLCLVSNLSDNDNHDGYSVRFSIFDAPGIYIKAFVQYLLEMHGDVRGRRAKHVRSDILKV